MLRYLNHFNPAFIEELLARYRADPESIDPSWRFFFDGMSFGREEQTAARNLQNAGEQAFEFQVLELIQAYREMAYLMADVNPLDRNLKQHPLLKLKNFGLSEADLSRTTRMGKLLGLGDATLGEILTVLKTYYCSTVAVETAHIEDPKSRYWVQSLVEAKFLLRPLEENLKKRALEKLTEAETFERFLHKRFVGQKRFSLEGTDVLIPMLDHLIDKVTALGADEIILGMAHRGRLNVLANIFGKDLRTMFAEFSGNLETEDTPGDGDVKYHMGYSIDTRSYGGKEVHLSLAPNPSHLEAINPVVMGMARSKQKAKGDEQRTRTVVVMLHGDASFSGQGSIFELLNISELKGYTIGGAIHLVINNQIGFTTEPRDARSTAHATDVAKMLQAPIFRVNADEPESALRCIDMAVQYRTVFKRDVFIDLIGYRRYGHNEGDEPAFTQPVMTKKIASHATVRTQYAESLREKNIVSREESEALITTVTARFEAALEETRKMKFSPKMAAFGKRWTGLSALPPQERLFDPVDTRVSSDVLADVGLALTTVQAGFNVHPKLARLLDDHRDMLAGKRGIDWGFAEALAFGSLIKADHPVRLAGQDVQRGTFSHRHCVWFDAETGEEHVPLNRFAHGIADFEPVNSPLSEYAALGFELGQSWANPHKLTLWEAQFGDFINGAQIIIDQFLVSAHNKWQRYSGLVLLLPHGYEGQGPEHSSARMERFLLASAQNNIQVCNMTTPAQYFHVLRRQVLRKYRLPLVIFTPKSLLRHPLAVSKLTELENGGFHEILDGGGESAGTAERLVLCSGKIYYELRQQVESANDGATALLCVEQFYPFPRKMFREKLDRYPAVGDIVWCQEEPENMGAWWFMKYYLEPLLPRGLKLRYVGRPPQASTAHGYTHVHQREQELIVKEALGMV